MAAKSPKSSEAVVFTTQSMPNAGLGEDRGQVVERLLGLLDDPVADEIRVVQKLKPHLARSKVELVATIACEYGAPWKGAGALSVRTTVFSDMRYSFGAATPGERSSESLEDRPQHVLGVADAGAERASSTPLPRQARAGTLRRDRGRAPRRGRSRDPHSRRAAGGRVTSRTTFASASSARIMA